MDLVYVVRPGENNEELRYSLRSVCAHLPHGRVWIAGHMPSWVVGVGHIPTQQTRSKWANSTVNMRAACRHRDVSEQFVYMNDDFFVLEPLARMPILHRGPLRDVLDHYGQARSAYAHGMRETANLLRLLGLDEPLFSYELHAPLPVAKRAMLEVLDLADLRRLRYPLHKRTLYGNYWAIGGQTVQDCKVLRVRDPIPAGSPLVSTTDALFRHGAAGRAIRRMFAEPCVYERGARIHRAPTSRRRRPAGTGRPPPRG